MVYWWFLAVHGKVRWSVASPGWSGRSAEFQVRWTSLFMIWSGEQQFHLDGQVNTKIIRLSWVIWLVRLISLSSGWLDWSSWHQCWWCGQVNSFFIWLTWLVWVNHNVICLAYMAWLVKWTSMSIGWLGDMGEWPSTFLVGWPGQVTLGDKKSCVTGEHYCQLVGLVGQVNIFVDDMVRWTASPSWAVWPGEHHCQRYGLVDSSFTWLVRWAPLSMVWLFNQQLCMVGLVCQVNSSFTCLAYLVEWTALW